MISPKKKKTREHIWDRFVKQIDKIIPTIEKENINLSLETDLAPNSFLKLLFPQ